MHRQNDVVNLLFNLFKFLFMEEFKKKSNEPRDYKERFEFVFTTGGNIICQRYFRINNFNPTSLRSYELTSAIRECAARIDKDLKEKSQVYLELYAPRIFQTKEEMDAYIANRDNWRLFRYGEGIVIKGDNETDYAWAGNGVVKELGYKFDNGELSDFNEESVKTTYKFAFKVDEREVCAIEWEGYYPKFVRDKIDLANKWGKFSNVDVDRLSMEQYLLYKMAEGRSDMVYGLIKTICFACSIQNNSKYTTIDYTKEVSVYNNKMEIANPVKDEKYDKGVDEVIKSWNKDSGAVLYRMF